MARFSKLLLLVLATGLAATGASAAVQIARSVPIAPAAGATEAVKAECQLETLVPAEIQKAGADVQLVDAPSKSGKALELSISEVHAPGGGPFSGPKWMAVSGQLFEKGKLVGSFRAKRLSTSPRSTCGTLARITQAIGRDIAGWLQAPTMNAELGDAR